MRKFSIAQLKLGSLAAFLLIMFCGDVVQSKEPGSVQAKVEAQKKLTPSAASLKKKPGSREFLWKLSSESGATLFLLGTIHVVKSDFYPLPDEMEKAFAKSKAILMELDMSKQDKEKSKELVRQLGLYAGNDVLTHHMSAFTANEIQKFCTNNKLSFDNLVHLKPWLASLTILQTELQRLGYNSKDGIDLHFTTEANAIGKKIIGLETEEFQLKLFAGLPEDLQDQMLSLTLVDMALIPEDAGKLMQAWKDGDDEAMDEVSSKDVREHPEFAPVQEKILFERNVSMAEKLEPYLKGNDTYMVAVGSAHLVGDRSIIQLLKKKGYKVTQVKVGDTI